MMALAIHPHSSFRQFMVVATCAITLTSCDPTEAPTPFYDDDIGMEAEPIEEGSMAGTFTLKTVNATLIHIPIMEDQMGGGTNFRLVTRTWDADSGRYLQRSQLCGGFNFEVAGVVTNSPESTYRAVPESTEEWVEIDHETGQYVSGGHLQLWALRDLDDPFNSPIPQTAEEAAIPEHADHIYDMDDDGNPGMTMFVAGMVEGEVYAIQRKTVDLEGITLGPDRSVGLADNQYTSVMIGNNNSLLDQSSDGSSEPHPDPKESWYEEIRIEDDADCDRVMELMNEGVPSRLRPF